VIDKAGRPPESAHDPKPRPDEAPPLGVPESPPTHRSTESLLTEAVELLRTIAAKK